MCVLCCLLHGCVRVWTRLRFLFLSSLPPSAPALLDLSSVLCGLTSSLCCRDVSKLGAARTRMACVCVFVRVVISSLACVCVRWNSSVTLVGSVRDRGLPDACASSFLRAPSLLRSLPCLFLAAEKEAGEGEGGAHPVTGSASKHTKAPPHLDSLDAVDGHVLPSYLAQTASRGLLASCSSFPPTPHPHPLRWLSYTPNAPTHAPPPPKRKKTAKQKRHKPTRTKQSANSRIETVGRLRNSCNAGAPTVA